jgi:FtsP/CotA-like multicopper oxidase with cupredoxin domain
MYGALIVDPKDPARDAAYDYDRRWWSSCKEWLERDGYTYPAMTMEGRLPNYFTINGKSYPETETVRMEVGERLRIRSSAPTTTSSTRCTCTAAPSR